MHPKTAATSLSFKTIQTGLKLAVRALQILLLLTAGSTVSATASDEALALTAEQERLVTKKLNSLFKHAERPKFSDRAAVKKPNEPLVLCGTYKDYGSPSYHGRDLPFMAMIVGSDFVSILEIGFDKDVAKAVTRSCNQHGILVANQHRTRTPTLTGKALDDAIEQAVSKK